ncbi:MAG: aminoacyl-tRNA hydrolase [Nitrospinae bacterium]|nr:aminoacyl-tRNA hydrolase [Nitrospinota bacterium]
MIYLSELISLNEKEIKEDFIRASGPGGQNVNKVSTAVQLRFDVRNSASLQDFVKEKLIKIAGKRVSEDGVLIIEAKRYRTREANRQDAQRRLEELIVKALEKPKPRRKTKPTRSSNKQRLEIKKQRGEIKSTRKKVLL